MSVAVSADQPSEPRGDSVRRLPLSPVRCRWITVRSAPASSIMTTNRASAAAAITAHRPQ